MMESKTSIFFLSTVLILVAVAPMAEAGSMDDLAPTPPMGWNSWNTFRLEINEAVVRGIADMFMEQGYRDAGYEYIVIDDGWQIDRDADGNIMVNKDKFPSGIKALKYGMTVIWKSGVKCCMTEQGRLSSSTAAKRSKAWA
jgi:alpha-galactosidase